MVKTTVSYLMGFLQSFGKLKEGPVYIFISDIKKNKT
jgi:hypothetical protein